MHPLIKKTLCLLPPIKNVHKKLLELETQNHSLQQEKNTLSEKLAKIDSQYLLSAVRTPCPSPKEGEVSTNYYIEVLSHCNLRCTLCAHGHAQLFERAAGIMSLELFEKILDKIKEDSPSATVSPYHHCEPILHPQLPEMIRAIKARGFSATASFNWNFIRRLDDLLASGIDQIQISVSGFSQEIYQRAHVRGKIDSVKKNLVVLREAMDRLGVKPDIYLTYHMYKDNTKEDYEHIKDFVESLGFTFFGTWARNISLELTLLYLHQSGLSRYIPPYGQKSWFADFPSLPQSFMDAMERIVYLPQDYLQGKFQSVTPLYCNIHKVSVNIRWNGKANLCFCAFDDRLVMGDFLTMPHEQYLATRNAHPVCLECRANNALFYFQYADMTTINEIARARLGKDSDLLRGF